jgi:hypothetical protein
VRGALDRLDDGGMVQMGEVPRQFMHLFVGVIAQRLGHLNALAPNLDLHDASCLRY